MPTTFQYRVLVVDDDEALLETTSSLLAEAGYEVRKASDGFEALAALRDAQPEVIVADLNMPKMSGFELLAIVRKRFPGIGVIVLTGEFSPLAVPEGVLSDRFLAKGENCGFELLEAVRELIAQLPVRSQQAKTDVAPAWLPHSESPYVVLTCPACLRSFSVRTRDLTFGAVQKEVCLHCGGDVRYRIDKTLVESRSVVETLRKRIESSERRIAETRTTIAESKKLITKR